MKRKLALAALMMILLTVAVPTVALAAGSDATVAGVVSSEGAPLASASVLVEYMGKGGLPRRSDVVTTSSDGSWSYAGKAGDYRLTFSADGYEDKTEVLHADAKSSYTVNAQLSPIVPPQGTITGRITSASGVGMSGFAYFYKQNNDGTWPTGYLSQVQTSSDGTYSSPPLPMGVYKVRLFTVHTGVQWYRYAATMDLATPITLSTPDQVASGIDAIYPPPAP